MLGLPESNDENQISGNSEIVCSIPVSMKEPDEIIPIELNLSNDTQAVLTHIIKVNFLYIYIYTSFMIEAFLLLSR